MAKKPLDYYFRGLSTPDLLLQLDKSDWTEKELDDPKWGEHRRGWMKMREKQAERDRLENPENPKAAKVKREYDDDERYGFTFDKAPLGTEYFYDLGLSRKNFSNFLPYLTGRVRMVGPGGTDMSALQYQNASDPSGRAYGENWNSAMKYHPREDHKIVRDLVKTIKDTDVRSGEDRRKALKNWAELFSNYEYGNVARELLSHNSPPVLQPEALQAEQLVDLTADDEDEEPPRQRARGSGARGKCIDNLSKSKVSKKGLQESYDRGIGAHKTNPSSVRNVQGKKGVGGKKMGKEQWACARAKKLSKLGDKAGYDGDLVKGGGYKITQHTKDQAKKLGVEVKPSQLAKKKIDVFRGGRKVASVGHKDYCDYPTFRECCGTKMANARREAYKTRHEKTRHKEGTPSYYADKLLW